MDNIVAIDFETYYDGDYSLKGMSTWNYVHDPRFDAYLVAIHGPDFSWVGHPSNCDWSRIKGAVVAMHNASFDSMVLDRLVALGVVPVDCTPCRIVCTADLAAYMRCQRNLGTASRELLGIVVSKQVRTDMKGRHYADAVAAGMEADLLKYGGSDAELCYKLAEKFLPLWPENEQRVSELNRQAGVHGVSLDSKNLDVACALLAAKTAEMESQLPWMNGDVEDAKPLSLKCIRIQGRRDGIPVPASLDQDLPEVQKWRRDYGDKFPWVNAIGEYRSVNILHQRVLNMKSNLRADGTMPFQILYYGGHTGRMSGGAGGASGGKFNMQNQPSKPMHGVDVRSLIVPRPGHLFIIADYSQIEPRALLWRIGDRELIQRVRDEGNLYIAYALKTRGQKIQKGTYEYKLTKAQVLLLGYHGGWKRFQSQAAQAPYFLTLTEEEAQAAVNEYRSKNPGVVNHWHEHQRWLQYSVNHGDPTHEVELPDGRKLVYFEPKYEDGEITARHVRGGPRLRLHSGVLTNNEIQSMCYGVLRDAWVGLDRELASEGCRVLFTVHDEFVIEVPSAAAPALIPEIKRIMVTSSPWIGDCPLDAEVVVSDHYLK